MREKVVARYKDGRIIKGYVEDFNSKEGSFTLIQEGKESRIEIEELKGLFFVKDFEGNKKYDEIKDFLLTRGGTVGEKTILKFNDGEIIYGYSVGYHPSRKGFFLFPSDPNSNNSKIYVVMSSVEGVKFLL